ncbi:WAVH2 [Symbiodinium sp. CCMP2592]|nr:WAVH2 [Symbiodinium sp. CCMP2592]
MIAAWWTLLACFGIQAARAGLTVEYLVVAGGGGGGSGGGGAGGVLQDSVEILPGSVWEVVVGAGGIGGYGGSPFGLVPPNPVQSTSGGNSVLGPIVSFGGGFGAGVTRVPGNGGSGGGGGFDRPNINPGRGTPGQGNDGGISDTDSFGAGGGGGGAGQAGSNAPAIHLGGNGGDGVESNITGTVQWFGGGGGGGVNQNNGQVVPNGGGIGGMGGGGNGSSFGIPVVAQIPNVPRQGTVVLALLHLALVLENDPRQAVAPLLSISSTAQLIMSFQTCNYWGDPHYTASWGPHGRFDYQGLGVHEVVNNSQSCQSFRMQAFHCQYRRTSNAVTLGVAFLLDNNTRVFMNDSFVSVTPGGEGRVTVSGPLTNAQLSSGVDIQTGDSCNFASINGVRIRGKPGYILNAQIRAHEEVDAPQGICGAEFLVSTFVSDSADYLFTDEEFVDMCNHCESFGGTGSPGCPGVTTTTSVPVALSDRCSFARPGVNANIPGTLSILEECQISSGTSPFDEYVQKQPTANLSSFDDVCVFYFDSSSGIKSCNAVCSLLGTTCNNFLGRVGVGASGSCATATSDFADCDSEPVGEAICACNINQDFIPNAGESIQDIAAAAQADPNINFEDAVGNCSTGWLEGVVLPANLSNTSITLTVEQFNVLSCVADWVFAEPEDRAAIVEITQEQDPVIPPNQCQGTDGAQLEDHRLDFLCKLFMHYRNDQYCNHSCTYDHHYGCTYNQHHTSTHDHYHSRRHNIHYHGRNHHFNHHSRTHDHHHSCAYDHHYSCTYNHHHASTHNHYHNRRHNIHHSIAYDHYHGRNHHFNHHSRTHDHHHSCAYDHHYSCTYNHHHTSTHDHYHSRGHNIHHSIAYDHYHGRNHHFNHHSRTHDHHHSCAYDHNYSCTCNHHHSCAGDHHHGTWYNYNSYYGSALEIEDDEDDFDDTEEGAFLQDPRCEKDDDTCEDELLEFEDDDTDALETFLSRLPAWRGGQRENGRNAPSESPERDGQGFTCQYALILRVSLFPRDSTDGYLLRIKRVCGWVFDPPYHDVATTEFSRERFVDVLEIGAKAISEGCTHAMAFELKMGAGDVGEGGGSWSMSMEASVKAASGAVESNGLSMLDIAKHAVRTVIQTLDSQDRLCVITFCRQAELVLPLLPMDEEGKARAEQVLEKMTFGSGTALWQGLNASFRELHSKQREGSFCHTMLLTDGETEDSAQIMQHLQDAKAGYGGEIPGTVSTFGFGYEIDSKLLVKVASFCDGTYAFIPDAGFVGTIFVNSISNLLATSGMNAKLQVKPLEAVQRVLGGFARVLVRQPDFVDRAISEAGICGQGDFGERNSWTRRFRWAEFVDKATSEKSLCPRISPRMAEFVDKAISEGGIRGQGDFGGY